LTGKKPTILIYGYGNPGRQDDGLGVMLAEEMGKWAKVEDLTLVHTDSNYQLNLEDAEGISGFDTVIFADASREDITPFLFEPLVPSEKVEFTMHAVSPAFVLHLCHQLFNRKPKAYLLHIRGYKWEFMKEMTEGACNNLKMAVDHLKKFITEAY
jgi:hydrogenase maturation protease